MRPPRRKREPGTIITLTCRKIMRCVPRRGELLVNPSTGQPALTALLPQSYARFTTVLGGGRVYPSERPDRSRRPGQEDMDPLRWGVARVGGEPDWLHEADNDATPACDCVPHA